MLAVDFDSLSLTKQARDVVESLKDFRLLLRRLGKAVEDFWVERFQREGPGWVPLAESTLAKRRQEGKGAKILRDDGRLFASLSALESDGYYELSKLHLTIGTNLEYAEVHDKGLGHVPRRPILPTEEDIAPDFERVIERWAAEVIP